MTTPAAPAPAAPSAPAASAPAAPAAAPAAPAAAAAPAAPAPESSATPAAPAAPAAAAPSSAPAAPAAAPAAPAAAAPVKLDLKLPENSTLDPSALETTAATASALNLSHDGATKVLDLVNQVAAAHAEKAAAAVRASFQPGGTEWNKQLETAKAAVAAASLSDPDLGAGDPAKRDAAVALATRVVATFGRKDTVDLFAKDPAASSPAVLAMLVKIGKAMKEDDFVVAPSSTSGEKVRAADVLYPTTAVKKD